MISNQVLLSAELVALLGTIPYVEVVARRKYRSNDLPDFDKFAIIISPFTESEQHEMHTNSLEYLEGIQIIPIVRNYNSELSVYGTTAPNIGILQFVQDIKDLLRSSSLDGLVTVTKHELDEEIKFSEIHSENREYYYHEAPILWTAQVDDANPMPEPHP